MNMKHFNPRWVIAGLFSAVVLLGQVGCQCSQSSQPALSSKAASAPANIVVGPDDQPGPGQTVFTSDTAASAALLAAVTSQNHHALHAIFGPDIKELATGDKVEDHRHFEEFVAHAKQKFQLYKENPTTSIVLIGDKNWPFPIPIVRLADGQWFFDTAAGKSEILARRIGGDELEAINVCLAYVKAQKQYFSTTHDGSSVAQYAQRLDSKVGTHDGLYWPATTGQTQSPFSALAAQAQAAGYTPGAHKGPHPFFGYYFRILTRQGPAAPGGAMNYLRDGKMVRGFALLAFPDKYAASGVMTFIVNQQGVVYQKNLGPQTVTLARKITTYNPDPSWAPIPR